MTDPPPDELGLLETLRIADRLGVDVSVAAARADGSGPVLRHAPEVLWPGASLFKVLAAIALLRSPPADLEDRVTVAPADRVPGGAGLSLLTGPVTLSWRDLTISMLTGSDNTAAHVIMRAVGTGALAQVADEAGMASTRIAPTARTVGEAVRARHEGPRLGTERDDRLLEHAALDQVLGSLTTAEDQIALMRALWGRELLPAAETEFVLEVMTRQLMRTRVSSAFDHPGVRVAGKTGTWGPFRHESALVMHDGEVPIALSVLTESMDLARLLPPVDDGIGEIAAALVADLRSRRPAPHPTS